MSSSTNKAKKTLFAGGRSVAASKRGMPASTVDSQTRIRQTRYGVGSRTNLSSSSKKNLNIGQGDKGQGPNKPPVQVFDDNDRDVTPLPLLQMDPGAVRKNQSNILADSSAGTPTDLMSQASIYQTGTVGASTFGGPFTRSVFSASQSAQSTTASISEDMGGETMPDYGWGEITHKREDVKEELTESDLEKTIDIELTETETIWLLDLPGVCVSQDSEEATSVQEKNARYQELTKNRVGNDRYMERGMVTFNEPPKVKSVQTTRVSSSDAAVMATNWDMHDTFQAKAEEEAKAKAAEAQEGEGGSDSRPVSATAGEKKDDEKAETGSVGKDERKSSALNRSQQASRATSASFAGTDSVFASKDSGVTAVPEPDEAISQELLNSEKLLHDLFLMERVVNMNTYQPRQACYRNLEVVPDIDKVEPEEETGKPRPGQLTMTDMGPNLDRLWAYQCPLTKGRNVSCMAWNKLNPDLLAVGYGQFEFSNQKGGLVCCWSLKNPEHPERVYVCAEGATALDFSTAHPNLLAVGMYDGSVAIYNVRSTNNEPILDSISIPSIKLMDTNNLLDGGEATGKHAGPVWQLKWIEKERGSGEESAEVLVSVSTDGRVTQWSIRKGFESYDLMKLKRLPSKLAHVPKGKEKKAEAFISRHAGGLCFDFSCKDTNIYLAGSEEGYIHKCSCSYNEQYLDTYEGHTGPVYRIQWSPFLQDAFLSCSGDWSIRLWHQDRLKPVLTFHSSTKAVHDVSWSPKSSTVFACVNEGAVEVWDLSQSTLDPIIVNNPMPGVKLSAVTFAKNSDCILVGDNEGQVSVYQLRCMSDPHDTQAETLNKIMQASVASQLDSK